MGTNRLVLLAGGFAKIRPGTPVESLRVSATRESSGAAALDRAGQRSIRINDQWRICFTWKALGTSDRFWMNLQNRYDLDVQFEAHRDELDKIKSLVARRCRAGEGSTAVRAELRHQV